MTGKTTRQQTGASKAGKTKAAHPSWEFHPIGVIRTAFTEKFGIPRQPGLASSAEGVIELNNHPFLRQACKELDQFSHLWILFVFHEHRAKEWKPSIRPPRLGGEKRVGVLSSRSPHRPNPIGLSAVKIEKVDLEHPKGARIHVTGVDILDGSPVLDIKPYLPYADIIADANSGWASQAVDRKDVTFSEKGEQALQARLAQHPRLRELVIEMVELDPRPASQKRRIPADQESSIGMEFGFKLFTYDVKWKIAKDGFVVTDIEDLIDGVPSKFVKSRK